jgi:hypothetical protein
MKFMKKCSRKSRGPLHETNTSSAREGIGNEEWNFISCLIRTETEIAQNTAVRERHADGGRISSLVGELGINSQRVAADNLHHGG